MEQPISIRLVRHGAIESDKWNVCIRTAANGLIYAQSAYLDAMAGKWDALVVGDYETVMPLTWKKKWGINYLYQPFLTAQGGIFGEQAAARTPAFLAFLQKEYRFAEICLNYGNTSAALPAGATLRNNFVLSLAAPYDVLSTYFNENTRRNSKKCRQAGAVFSQLADAEQVITIATRQMQAQGHQPGEGVQRFRKIFQQLATANSAKAFGVFDTTGFLLASAVFFYGNNRAYYILVGNSPEARQTGASHMLIDCFIEQHAGSGLLLDFEGSDIPSLAHFYKGFGAENQPYPFYRYNHLPFFIRWLKR